MEQADLFRGLALLPTAARSKEKTQVNEGSGSRAGDGSGRFEIFLEFSSLS